MTQANVYNVGCFKNHFIPDLHICYVFLVKFTVTKLGMHLIKIEPNKVLPDKIFNAQISLLKFHCSNFTA